MSPRLWPSLVVAPVAAVLLAVSASPASAGYCDEQGQLDLLAQFDKLARSARAPAPDLDEICLDDIVNTPKLAARLVKACDAILARDTANQACVIWGVRAGGTRMGGLDMFAAIGRAVPMDPFAYGNPTLGLYLRLGDARAVALVRGAWQAGLADARAAKKKHAHAWGVWQRDAVTLFERLGGAEERAFLIDRAKVTRAKGMSRAIKRAIAAIDKRLAAAPGSTPAAPP